MGSALHLAHFGLRTRNLPASVAWYAKVFGAKLRFRNDMAAFMSFDDEHHRFVLWDDGDTSEKPDTAAGVDHIGFGCGSPADLAETYERLKGIEVLPALCVNHGFTCSIYYRDPDGNEVEITCDNFPSKSECSAFMRTAEMEQVMQPPFFGSEFDPEELVRLRTMGASWAELARIGL
jgi:catechol-2,3-dioxygenase